MKQKPKIIVIGSGIVGASVAMSCHNLGADVVVLERDKLGGSASSKSFGWINASFAESTDYYKLRNAAVSTFKNLTKEINLSGCVQWQGTLWWEDSGHDLERQFNTLIDRGYVARLLNKNEIKSLEPNLKEIPKEAIFTSLEGAAEADRVALEILNKLSKKGGKVLSGCTVSGLKFKKACVSAVQTNICEIQCEIVAIATLAATQK